MTAPSVELNTPPAPQQSGAAETDPPAARSTDPETSHEGANNSKSRRESQRRILLLSYLEAGDKGLTAIEAGISSGLASNPSCCYWKRCSELLAMGLLEEVYDKDGLVVKRTNPHSKSAQRVLRIKPEVQAYLANAE